MFSNGPTGTSKPFFRIDPLLNNLRDLGLDSGLVRLDLIRNPYGWIPRKDLLERSSKQP